MRISTFGSIGLLMLLAACGGGGGGDSTTSPAPPPPPVDTTPNNFTFTSQTGTALSAVVTSNEITVGGINANAAVSIAGGEYSIDGGAFTTAAGTVSNNQRIRVRLSCSGQFSSPVSATLTVGGVSVSFTATTLEGDTTPAAFQFQRSINATRGAWVVSNSATITDINTLAPVSIENGEYAIAGGTFTSAAGTISAGQTLAVRARAFANYSKVTRARLTVGTVSADFEVTTELPNYVPDSIAYDGQDVVYLLSNANRLVFRWSVAEARYLDAYTVAAGGAAPTSMAYSSAHHRVYLGYGSGAIRQIDVNAAIPAEAAFATMTGAVSSLGSAGNFLLAQVGSFSYDGGRVLNSSGVTTDHGGYYYGYSRETAWDPVTSRVYFTRDGLSPNDLHYDVIDQVTGQVTATGETPYHGSYNIQTPIRVSVDGQHVLMGSGDIYTQAALDWSGSLGSQVADARWFTDGSLVTLATSGNQTTLRRRGAGSLTTLEQLSYAGQALRVVGTDTRMAVLVSNNNTVQFHTYVPTDDSDGDGVPNTQDAFPLDRAASVDTDRDGYPDAWNAGRSQADSTTGLTLDAFPQDAACYLPAHGSGGVCNYGATIPNYTPDQIVQNGDVIYLLSTANRRVYRWSITAGAYLNPYVVGINQGFSTVAPTRMAYSSGHQRLYLGYGTGAIRYIDTVGGPAEIPFANTAMAVNGLAAVGNYVLAQDPSGAWATHYVINSSGVITDSAEWNYHSRDYAWDANTSRVYFFRDDSSPNDLHFEAIDQATGQISSAGETPYHGSYSIQPPIRVSGNGLHILLGSGDIYNRSGLTWSGSLGMQVADARWLANGSLVTLATASNQTTLRRLAATNLAVLEQVGFTGQALRVVGTDSRMTVLVLSGGTVQFHTYVPNDDSDGDGVLNTLDAFPLDRAASLDTDRDGYPDAWNAGRSQADSTTGLTLDAFPQDAACYLSAHGSGGICNYNATIPNYIPDKVTQNGDVIYLLSSANRRVYRWSMSTAAYLNPYVVGLNQGFSTVAPVAMEYSASHQRLYLGYATGAIRYIDVNAGPAEVTFATMAAGVTSLSSAGNFLLAQAGNFSYGGGHVLNSSGVTTDQGGYYYGYSRETAWDPVTSRVYYLRDGISPNDLHYDVIDQTTGVVTATGETPYHGDYVFQGPIRVTADGSQILLGSGDIYARNGLTRTSSVGKAMKDAHWKDNLLIDVDSTDRVEVRDANTRAVLHTYQYLGTPIRMLFGQSESYLVHVVSGTTAFVRLPFYDQDGDLMLRWWEQLYGLSDSNAADASTDLDGDGVDNLTEYLNLLNPTLSDTDAEGLTDSEEMFTYHTNPARADSDGDGLNDYAEVITHHSDPLDTDSDNDGYTDFDEVLYGGDPNDVSQLPQPLLNYSQTFENTPNLAAWAATPQSSAPWAVDSSTAHAGSASFKSGVVANSQNSAVRFRGFFRPGQLSFWARVDAGSCCNRLRVLVDGILVLYISGGTQWNSHALQLTSGIHDIEWRFERDSFGGQASDAARIDDVAFIGQ